LSLLHQLQVKIRLDLKEIQHLIQHFPMLPGHANP
jgi:hypothetical protein